MNSFINKFFILLFVLVAAYCTYSSITKIEDGYLGLLEDKRSGNAVGKFYKKYNFTWQESLRWWFAVRKVDVKTSTTVNIEMPIPPLERLDGDAYTIKGKIKLDYNINREKFRKLNGLSNNKAGLQKSVKTNVMGIVRGIINPYLVPIYKRNELFAQKETILKNIELQLGDYFKRSGLDLTSFKVIDTILLPDQQVYKDGLTHLTQVRNIERKNELNLETLRSRLARKRLKDEELYNKLTSLSKIIKKNPDILKYMYIEKMADNVKVIVSSSGSAALPINFDAHTDAVPAKKQGTPASGNGEIDNLSSQVR
ncbi:MAG: hypothetical protein GY754_20075 [bacterium]|nr:hypothetical protein [bacterium]